MLRRLKYHSTSFCSPNNSAILRQFCLCKLKIISKEKSKLIFAFGINNLNSISYKNRYFSLERKIANKSYNKISCTNSIDNLLQYAKAKNIPKFISELEKMVDTKSVWFNNFEANIFAKKLLELKFSSTTRQRVEILTLLPLLGLRSANKHQRDLCLFYFNGIIDLLPKILKKNYKIIIFSRSLVGISKWKIHWNELREDKAKVEDCIRNLSADFAAPTVRSVIYS